MSDLLGARYRRLYQGYYDDGSVTAKRGMSAADALDHIRAIAGAESFNRVVDVGAGEGSLLQILDDTHFARELYALEISPSGLQAIQGRNLRSLVEAKPFDGYRIPYADKYFDLAILCHVLEHVEHERLLLHELRRVARRIVIEVPLEHGFRIDRKIAISSKFGHINYYLPETVVNLLSTSGLKVINSRIVCSSLRYEQHVAGRARGLLMSRLRRTALRLSPRMAPWLFTYLFTAYCEADTDATADLQGTTAA